MVPTERVQGLIESDEVTRDQLGSLVDELVERMLAIGSRLPPDNWPGLIVHAPALQIDMLSIALHLKLLEVGNKMPEVMIIGQDRLSLGLEEVVVPDADESQEHRQVTLERRRPELLIHGVETREHFAKMVRANSNHKGEADR